MLYNFNLNKGIQKVNISLATVHSCPVISSWQGLNTTTYSTLKLCMDIKRLTKNYSKRTGSPVSSACKTACVHCMCKGTPVLLF